MSLPSYTWTEDLQAGDGQVIDEITPICDHLDWDIDTMRVKVKAGCLSTLSDWWQTSSMNPRKEALDAPKGLTICRSPFYLILCLDGDPSEDQNVARQLWEVSHSLVSLLRESGPNHPLLLELDPVGHETPWSALSNQEARVAGETLDIALFQLGQMYSFSLWVFSYGMKLPATTVGLKLEAMYRDLRHATAEEEVQSMLEASYVDMATELVPHSGIWLAQSTAHLRFMAMDWEGSSLQSYPLLAGLGKGFGGLTMKAPRDSDLLKVCVYPGPWKHALNRAWRPTLLAPRNASQGFFYRTRVHFAAVQAKLSSWHAPLGGLRFEVRARLQEGWGHQLRFAQAVLEDILPKLRVLEVSRHTILQHMSTAYMGALEAGLFDTSGGLDSRAPTWKRAAYHRLLASFGYGHKFWCRKAFRMAMHPWRPHQSRQMEGDDMDLDQPPAGPPPHVPQVGQALTIDVPGLLPSALGNVHPTSLTLQEALVLAALPDRKVRGGKWVAYYRPPWGGSVQAKTRGYASKAALARACWGWALEDWHNRFRCL